MPSGNILFRDKKDHFFLSKERFPYSYLQISTAPPTGKYRPKHSEIDKKSFVTEIREEPDKSFVKKSTKVLPACFVGG